MTPSKLIIKAAIRIQKAPHDVYEAIVDPAKMSNYFISKGSGRMEEGKTKYRRLGQFPGLPESLARIWNQFEKRSI